MILTIPNILTFIRILLIPFVIISVLFNNNTGNIIATVLFLVASITDFIDGYLARRLNQHSRLGQFMDPIADKLLVSMCLMVLVGLDRINQWSLAPALIILAREIFVSGLREFLAELRIGMPVSALAKWKTGMQMVCLPFLLLGNINIFYVPAIYLGTATLWGAAVLTLITGYDYFKAGIKHFRTE